MSDAPVMLPPRQSVFDRIRGVMFLLLLGIGAFALYYSLFFERKTTYLSNRNARLIALLGDQIRRSIRTAGSVASNAEGLTAEKMKALYEYERAFTDNQPPQAIFDSMKPLEARETATRQGESHSAERRGDDLRITFRRKAERAGPSQDKFDLRTAPDEFTVEPKGVEATIRLRRLIDTVVRHAATGVFDTVFILDRAGNVVYQWTRQTDEDSDAGLKIIRLNELQVPRLFEGEVTLPAAALMTTSRQTPVRIGDRKYQLFSIPIRSNVRIGEKAPSRTEAKAEPPDPKAKAEPPATEAKAAPPPEQKAEIPEDTWVVCGAISNADFRSQALAIPATQLCVLAAVMLLVILSWPFLKMALSSAQQKVTLVDVILLGLGGVLAMSVVCLIVLDGFTYGRLKTVADLQLETFSAEIEQNFRREISTALDNLTRAQKLAEEQLTPRKPIDALNTGLLGAKNRPFKEGPWFQSFALIDANGWQRVKWSVEKQATPLVSVQMRSYFAGPLHEGRDYLKFRRERVVIKEGVAVKEAIDERVAIESVLSLTSGLPEVVFSRRTGGSGIFKDLPVIALSMPTAPSLIDPIVPEGFGFAIVNESGKVLFHSISARNTVENLFAETSDDPQVRSAVLARQKKTLNIRYLGEDHTAHIRPMQELPWTLVTFRERRWLRTLNTEALLITLILVLALTMGFLVLLAFVLLLRPRYRAEWLWPDPKRVGAYAELAAAYFLLLAVSLVLLLTLEGGALLLFPFCFIPLVLAVTYLYLRPKLQGIRWIAFVAGAALSAMLLIVQMWTTEGRGIVPVLAASILLVIIALRAARRPPETTSMARARERQTALPLCYVCAAFLLLLLTSIVPTTAFFKAAYRVETDSYVKRVQMKLGADLQRRWWRIRAEFDDARGSGKGQYRQGRWALLQDDIYAKGMFATKVAFGTPTMQRGASAPVFPDVIEPLLPVDANASVNTRELVRDEAADRSWWWMRSETGLHLAMENRLAEKGGFTISSVVPQLFPTLNATHGGDATIRQSASLAVPFALALLAIFWIAYCIARFIARRVFLVDLVHPLPVPPGYVGLRHVICHPCDDESARRLFRDFKKIDLSTAEGVELARTAPQSFDEREMAVFVDGVDYSCGSGERSEILRALLDRLTRNSDRTVVIRPTTLSVVTHSFLRGPDRAAWGEALAPFVWVNWSQLVATDRKLSLSGAMPAVEAEPLPEKKPGRWRSLYTLAGFDTYFEQFTDTRGAVRRMLKAETAGDPYLQTLVAGLRADATACDQVLDEIGERAEEYYAALWLTCNPHEQLVMMQLAQTGLVNDKTRKHVRRLLARGHLRRDPQLRVMNESFRRFVLTQSATSKLAVELEHDLAGDAWSRFRVPLFAGVAAVMLFFFVTQRQMFDSTIALVTGLAASLPAFVKMISGLGNRAKA